MDRLLVKKFAIAVALGLALAACAPADTGAARSESAGTGSSADENRNLPPIPEGAIKVGEDRYMVPMGQDENGCIAYRVFSQTKFVLMVIYFRKADGEFVMDRSEACPQ